MVSSPRAPETHHGISSHRISREEQMRLDEEEQEEQEEQMRLIHDAIKRDHRENDRGAAIIVVVCRELRPEEVEKKWKKHRWQLRKRRPFVRATKKKRLQDTIAKVSRNEDINHLTIIACEGIFKISPQVHAPRIQNMRILSCVRQGRPQKRLKIGRASSFNNKYLKDCAPRRGYNSSQEFNCNVNITLEREKSSTPPGNESDASDNENEEHEADSPSGTQETNTSGGWWKSWRGIVAGAVGLVVAAVKAVSSVFIAAEGYCLSLSWKSFSLHFADGSATASLSTSAACVAVGYGLVAFLVVYFVPWNNVFNWFINTAKSWYNSALSWWNGSMANGRRGGHGYSRVI